MQLTSFCLTLTCLRVSPDRSQFFRYDSVSLNCSDQANASGWKVKRRTPGGGVRPCTSGWGSASSGSTCTIRKAYPSDSGEYWCQSADGEKSNGVNITVTDRAVLLDSPALPVSDGAEVTLRCKAQPSSTHYMFHFHKDGRPISSSSNGEMTIHSASRSDEGVYTCSVAGGGESEGSWLAVSVRRSEDVRPDQNHNSTLASASASASGSGFIFSLMLRMVVGAPYLLSTIVMGLVYRKQAAQTVGGRRDNNVDVMEIIL